MLLGTDPGDTIYDLKKFIANRENIKVYRIKLITEDQNLISDSDEYVINTDLLLYMYISEVEFLSEFPPKC